jgi:hypothetical protein
MSHLAYLLDTNILSNLISDPHGPVMRRMPTLLRWFSPLHQS